MIRKHLCGILAVPLTIAGLSLPLFAQAEHSLRSRALLAQEAGPRAERGAVRGGQQQPDAIRQRDRDRECPPAADPCTGERERRGSDAQNP